MLLLLIRHAHAGDRDPVKYPDDTLRELTDRGRRTQKDVARWMRDNDLLSGAILSSPWVRAWQTAMIVAEICGNQVKPLECPALAGPPELPALRKAIEPVRGESVVALVGHDPWMGELAALLLSGRNDGLEIDFPKSGVLGLESSMLTAGEGVLRFFLRPKMAE